MWRARGIPGAPLLRAQPESGVVRQLRAPGGVEGGCRLGALVDQRPVEAWGGPAFEVPARGP
eukprot:8338850-Alexandrium_andersonii.AAC.1